MEKLRVYMERNCITVEDFAHRAQCTVTSVYRYRSGERIPNQAVMRRIYEITGGKVNAQDFYDMPKIKKAKRLKEKSPVQAIR